MDKTKIIFIVVVALTLGAVAGLGFLAYEKFTSAAEATAEADGDYSSLKKIYDAEIFPSKENVELIRTSQADYELSRTTITGALAKCNIPLIKDTTPVEFVGKLTALVDAKIKQAPIVKGVPCVAPNFAFGFDAYVGTESRMPDPQEVPLLGQQLIIISRLVDAMYASEVTKITGIRREAGDKASLGQGAGAGHGQAEPPVAEEASQVKKGKSKKGKKEVAPPAPLFTSQKVTLDFQATQTSLVALLNRLASMNNMFVVVRNFSIKKSAEDIMKPVVEEVVAEKGEEDLSGLSARELRKRQRELRKTSEKKSGDTAKASMVVSQRPAEMRIISGPEIDPPLSVHLEVEIYNFGKETK